MSSKIFFVFKIFLTRQENVMHQENKKLRINKTLRKSFCSVKKNLNEDLIVFIRIIC